MNKDYKSRDISHDNIKMSEDLLNKSAHKLLKII
jgi:hypothetical protein